MLTNISRHSLLRTYTHITSLLCLDGLPQAIQCRFFDDKEVVSVYNMSQQSVSNLQFCSHCTKPYLSGRISLLLLDRSPHVLGPLIYRFVPQETHTRGTCLIVGRPIIVGRKGKDLVTIAVLPSQNAASTCHVRDASSNSYPVCIPARIQPTHRTALRLSRWRLPKSHHCHCPSSKIVSTMAR